jgi:hypothetical protein
MDLCDGQHIQIYLELHCERQDLHADDFVTPAQLDVGMKLSGLASSTCIAIAAWVASIAAT